jgi:hypothetical protein
MYFVELQEGKDQPDWLGPLKYSDLGATTGLVMRATEEAGLWHSGKALVLDSGFGVLNVALQLITHGIYSLICFKKRRYWPRFINGGELLDKVEDADIGTTVTHQLITGRDTLYFLCLR